MVKISIIGTLARSAFILPSLLFLLVLAEPAFAAENRSAPVARVNGEEITLAELCANGTAACTDGNSSLEQLIDQRLIVQEAQRLGLEQLPGIREQVAHFVEARLREMLFREELKGIETDHAGQLRTMQRCTGELISRYVTPDQQVIETLDFSGKDSGSYLLDDRPLAAVEGEEPIRVAELAEAMRRVGGREQVKAAGDSRIGDLKSRVLHDLYARRAMQRAARDRGYDRRPAFAAEVKRFRDSLLFRSFVESIIRPGVLILPEEAEQYYQRHRQDFLSPKMIRLEEIVFLSEPAAREALQKYRAGAEFERLKPPPDQAPFRQKPIFSFEGRTLLWSSLPPAAREILADAAPGEVRFFADRDHNAFYLLQLLDVFPPRPIPFDEVQPQVVRRLYEEKQGESLRAWIGRLRNRSEIAYLQFSDTERLETGESPSPK